MLICRERNDSQRKLLTPNLAGGGYKAAIADTMSPPTIGDSASSTESNQNFRNDAQISIAPTGYYKKTGLYFVF